MKNPTLTRSNKRKETSTIVAIAPAPVRVRTEEETLTDAINSLNEYKTSSKAAMIKNLRSALRTLKEGIEECERDINQVEKGNSWMRDDDLVKQVNHTLAWAMANGESNISTASRYSNEFLIYTTQLSTMLKYSELARNINQDIETKKKEAEKAEIDRLEQLKLEEAKASSNPNNAIEVEFIGIDDAGQRVYIDKVTRNITLVTTGLVVKLLSDKSSYNNCYFRALDDGWLHVDQDNNPIPIER